MQAFEQPRLPHLPLWQGAAYRLIRKTDIIPVRLVLASVLQHPRTHIFEHLDTFEEYTVQEHAPGQFCMDNAEITVEFA